MVDQRACASSLVQWMKHFRMTSVVLGLLVFHSIAFAQTNTFPSSGNVGIGTTSPEMPVHVYGGSADSVLMIDSPQQTAYNPVLTFREQSTAVWNIGMDTNDGSKLKIAAGGYYDNLRIRPFVTVDGSGNVGIGTTNPGYLLSVKGIMGAEEVLVTNAGWSDYVFDPGYHLQPLGETAKFIKENHHLPDIPSEAEVREKGVSLGEMQSKLLAKVEELTLHMIEADERIQRADERNQRLEEQNHRLQERVASLEEAEKKK